MKIKDDEIIEKILKGNINLFELLFKKYRYLVKSRIIKIIGNSPDVDDLVQEVFFKAFKHLKRYDNGKSKFSTWISTIAHNLTVDFLKKRHMNTFSLNSFFGEDAPLFITDSSDPVEVFIENENLKFLFQCLSRLPKKYFEVLELRYLQNKSYAEIAKILNIPLGTVMIRLFRAKKNLVKISKEYLKGSENE